MSCPNKSPDIIPKVLLVDDELALGGQFKGIWKSTDISVSTCVV